MVDFTTTVPSRRRLDELTKILEINVVETGLRTAR
jgi:hypothetical protein